MNKHNAYFAVPDARHSFQVNLLSVFDEIAQAFLETAQGNSLQRYLDGKVTIGGDCFTRRAILLAIHDMKENLEAPLALQEKVFAELSLLRVLPAPQLKLYRDIATALLRIEVVKRSVAVH